MTNRTADNPADNPATEDVRYDPYDLAIRENPYPWYARLRDEAPVYHVAEHHFWAISRYDDVFAAVRTPERFSSAEGIAIERTAGIPIMIAMDPPDHTRLRRLVQKEFTPAGVAHWEPRIQAVCDKLIEDLIRANEEGHADLTAGEVPDLRGILDDLVGRGQGEVPGHHLHHRPQAHHRHADGRPDHAQLGDGGIHHAPVTEPIEQSLGDAKRSGVHADVFAHEEHVGIALHLLHEGGADGIAVRHLRHQEPSSP